MCACVCVYVCVCSVHIGTIITLFQSPLGGKWEGWMIHWWSYLSASNLFLIYPCVTDLFYCSRVWLFLLIRSVWITSSQTWLPVRINWGIQYVGLRAVAWGVILMYSLVLPRGSQCPSLIVVDLKQKLASCETTSQVCQDPSTNSLLSKLDHVLWCICGTLTWTVCMFLSLISLLIC